MNAVLGKGQRRYTFHNLFINILAIKTEENPFILSSIALINFTKPRKNTHCV